MGRPWACKMDLKNMSWDEQSQNLNEKRFKLAILDVWSSCSLGTTSSLLCLLLGKVLVCDFCVKSAEKPLASLRKKRGPQNFVRLKTFVRRKKVSHGCAHLWRGKQVKVLRWRCWIHPIDGIDLWGMLQPLEPGTFIFPNSSYISFCKTTSYLGSRVISRIWQIFGVRPKIWYGHFIFCSIKVLGVSKSIYTHVTPLEFKFPVKSLRDMSTSFCRVEMIKVWKVF